jgi:striatin 1/3/4
MRFLQSEWHRHERDRNAWDIERAEMKSRIGKLEGDRRTAQRLKSSLEKHVKLLENALKQEREKSRKLQKGQSLDEESATDLKENIRNVKREFIDNDSLG